MVELYNAKQEIFDKWVNGKIDYNEYLKLTAEIEYKIYQLKGGKY